jgi:purine-binding chemotaxis protein CheW
MPGLHLIAKIAGTKVAIASDMIESVIRVTETINVPRVAKSVAGLFALRSRVLTLIDSQYLITGKCQTVTSGALAIVAEIAGYQYGLLVDSVHDVIMIEADDIENAIMPGPVWAKLTKSLVNVNDELVIIIDPAMLLMGERDLAA